MICEEDMVVHLRPSGNAPELRFYAEAGTSTAAQALLEKGLSLLQAQFAMQ
jgi:phosphomannomutase